MDLAAIPFCATRHDGVAVHRYCRDERSGRAVLLVRMEPGCGCPAHVHRGREETLVLQGGYRDESGEHRAGQVRVHEAGTGHAPVALAGGGAEPCVLLVVAHAGVSPPD